MSNKIHSQKRLCSRSGGNIAACPATPCRVFSNRISSCNCLIAFWLSANSCRNCLFSFCNALISSDKTALDSRTDSIATLATLSSAFTRSCCSLPGFIFDVGATSSTTERKERSCGKKVDGVLSGVDCSNFITGITDSWMTIGCCLISFPSIYGGVKIWSIGFFEAQALSCSNTSWLASAPGTLSMVSVAGMVNFIPLFKPFKFPLINASGFSPAIARMIWGNCILGVL